ncbi:receptor-like protein EIX2 isoform X2 [Quercus suber]|uniref:receptor-like protein EIX2 isoform X2 n=1 Tax=Quercus suber TaxID=58331 RepID=UPI000CE248A5|nr:receptor-like protein EIX2 isoform X2 [Quercus suber]
MIKVMGGSSLKLLYAFLTLFLHLIPALGFTSGVGNGSVLCIEKERQALLEFKKGFVNGNDNLSSWGSTEDEKNCCDWDEVYCDSQTGHVIELNLGSYGLRGLIPKEIGHLKQIESLDLSRNQLFGSIPASIADLNFLSFLNLSYNKLSGRIPTGTQIQIANPAGFIGNLALCGPPLTPKCPGDVKPNAESPKGGSKSNQEDEDEFLKCLYIGMGLGFMVGFWGVCGSLMLNRSWRHLYFRTTSNLNDWLYVAMIVNIARLQRMFQG